DAGCEEGDGGQGQLLMFSGLVIAVLPDVSQLPQRLLVFLGYGTARRRHLRACPGRRELAPLLEFGLHETPSEEQKKTRQGCRDPPGDVGDKGASTHRAIRGEDGAIGAAIEESAHLPLTLLDQAFRRLARHRGKVVYIFAAEPAEAHPLVARHL